MNVPLAHETELGLSAVVGVLNVEQVDLRIDHQAREQASTASLNGLDRLILVGEGATEDVVGFGGGVQQSGKRSYRAVECLLARNAGNELVNCCVRDSHYLVPQREWAESAPVFGALSRAMVSWAGLRPCIQASRAIASEPLAHLMPSLSTAYLATPSAVMRE